MCALAIYPRSFLTKFQLMVPSVDEIEEYFQSLEYFLIDSLAAASPDLPNIGEAIHRLWVDISRFGPPGLPSFPDIHVPGLGAFEVPPPPPPPPPPRTLIEKAGDWIIEHPWKSSGIAVTVLGAGLLAGYTTYRITHYRKRRLRSTTVTPEKRQVVGVYCCSFVLTTLRPFKSCWAVITLWASR